MKFLYYTDWYKKRLEKIINIFGSDWFAGKKILELGACHGDIGIELIKLGAKVTFADYRQEHLDSISEKLKDYAFLNCEFIQLDQETKWNLNSKYDLVLHLGVLYHLKNWKQDLECAMQHSNTMILESLVHNNIFPDTIKKVNVDPFTEKYHGKNPKELSFFCQESVEATLNKIDCRHIRFENENLNSNICWERDSILVKHMYNWDYNNNFSNLHKNEFKVLVHHRRFWLVVK